MLGIRYSDRFPQYPRPNAQSRLMTSKRLVLLIAVFLVAVVAWEGLRSGTPAAGDTAPPFASTTIQGGRIALADYRGRSAVLLNFFTNH